MYPIGWSFFSLREFSFSLTWTAKISIRSILTTVRSRKMKILSRKRNFACKLFYLSTTLFQPIEVIFFTLALSQMAALNVLVINKEPVLLVFFQTQLEMVSAMKKQTMLTATMTALIAVNLLSIQLFAMVKYNYY